MVDIPGKVKDLFRQDGIKKNLRIRFLNDEHKDLTNEDIVIGTFSFTESLCSQEELKFGLCESSLLEFQCYGIGNVNGCLITACIEIDCSSLGTSWCNTYATKSKDVDFPYYSVSYGTFVIKSSVKSAGNVRKIEAYSATADSMWGVCDVETKKQRNARRTGTSSYATLYTFDVAKFLISNGYFSVDSYPKTKLETDSWGMGGQSYNYPYGYQLHFSVSRQRYVMSSKEATNILLAYNNVYAARVPQIIDELNAFVDKCERDGYKIIYTSSRESYMNGIFSYCYPALDTPSGAIYEKEGMGCIYPFINYDNFSRNVEFFMPSSVTLRLRQYDGTTGKDISGYSITSTINSDPSVFSVDSSSEPQVTLGYADLDEIDVRKIMEGFCELGGCFGIYTRAGKFERQWLTTGGVFPSETFLPSTTQYAQENTYTINRSQFSSCEYEDSETLPYAYVSAVYTNANGESDQYARVWIIDEDAYYEDEGAYRGYVCSDNYLVSNVKWEASKLNTILEGIASKIADIRYMPAKVTMKGLPYLEAGDIIEVRAEETFRTYIFRRILNGIHTLTDNVETK